MKKIIIYFALIGLCVFNVCCNEKEKPLPVPEEPQEVVPEDPEKEPDEPEEVKKEYISLTATRENVLKLFENMVEGDTLAYEKRAGANVLQAVKTNGNLIFEVWPGSTLTDNQEIIRTAMYALGPGDQLLFHEGEYGRLLPLTDGVGLYPSFSGATDAPIIVRGFGNGENRPVITRDNITTGDLWTINGNYIEVSYMEFYNATGWSVGLTRTSRSSEDIGLITDITIKDCRFDNSGDVSVAANWSWYHYNNITIENNVFVNANYTFVYIGQADGNAWGDNIIIRGNFFVGRPIDDPNVVGYAMQFKLNIHNSLVENNLILNVKGPGIAIYGANTTNIQGSVNVRPNIVRNNLVLGAGEGINILGGTARVFDNVAFECGYMGIRVQNRTSSDAAVRRDIIIQRNTSGFNEEESVVDYQNLGPGSDVIIDLGTVSDVSDNIYYEIEETEDNVRVQNLIKILRALKEKPAGFDAYFEDINTRPAPYTLSQLADKLQILTD